MYILTLRSRMVMVRIANPSYAGSNPVARSKCILGWCNGNIRDSKSFDESSILSPFAKYGVDVVTVAFLIVTQKVRVQIPATPQI